MVLPIFLEPNILFTFLTKNLYDCREKRYVGGCVIQRNLYGRSCAMGVVLLVRAWFTEMMTFRTIIFETGFEKVLLTTTLCLKINTTDKCSIKYILVAIPLPAKALNNISCFKIIINTCALIVMLFCKKM